MIGAGLLVALHLHQPRFDAQTLAIRDEPELGDVTIRYSTDGSEPATPYREPIKITPGTTVRATAHRGETLLFKMSERFGPDEGLYWPVDSE